MKIGEINPKHFEGIFAIIDKDVVVTEKQIAHIKERHPQDYERYAGYIPQILKDPDYIIEANRPNSVVLMKCITENSEHFQLILRLKAEDDRTEFMNSIITFMKIDDKRFRRYLRTKKILYKSV
ncbi:MAG: PBECR2 nuclease fold domain-containing protein [Oscillospiraceae bacterium]|nr:PBECR2 nuclease fold domain-containing protein [Oscillospiraceae bacterium]